MCCITQLYAKVHLPPDYCTVCKFNLLFRQNINLNWQLGAEKQKFVDLTSVLRLFLSQLWFRCSSPLISLTLFPLSQLFFGLFISYFHREHIITVLWELANHLASEPIGQGSQCVCPCTVCTKTTWQCSLSSRNHWPVQVFSSEDLALKIQTKQSL